MPTEAAVVAAKATKKTLSLDEIIEMAGAVRLWQAEKIALEALDRDFDKRVASELPKDEASFRKTLFDWMLGRTVDAQASLGRRRQNPIAVFLLGRMAEDRGDWAEAVDLYRSAARDLKNEPNAHLAYASALGLSGQREKAAQELDGIEKRFAANPVDAPKVAAEIAFQRGRLRDLEGDLAGALDFYDNALAYNPGHSEAAFRMGFVLDLRGDDAKAFDCYSRCAEWTASYTGAMTNLALLYEDRGDYEHAIACYRDVLRAEPANRRVRLFLTGAIESTEEVYDEVERKEQERLDQVLRTIVAEFELSVRSRNVLARMNIRTLGDLVQKTEAEMLAYKNFGETSLREIKQLLTAKGLRLGMGREEVERRHKRERLALVMSDRDSRVLATPVSDLNLSVRSRRCMARLNIVTIGDLITRTAEELLEMKNFGLTSLTELRAKLDEMGLSLRSGGQEAGEEPVEQEAVAASP